MRKIVIPSSSATRRDVESAEKRLRWLILTLAVAMTVGTIGYKLIEHGSWLDSLYMTVITIATVGFKEVFPMSDLGKIFTIFLIIFSTIILAYTIGTLGQFFFEGQFRNILGRRKMEKQISTLTQHYIVVGFGRVGQMVYSEFQRAGVPCVVIEREGASLEAIEKHAPLFVEGNAIDDEVLLEAGVERAKGLVNTIPDEADSVYIVLTARQLGPKLHIIARADTKAGEKKLVRAGADRVVLPYEIGGRRMAMASLRPNVVDFMTLESLGQHLGLSIEEVEVFKGSRVAGHTLRETELRSKYGLTVIGIKKPNGDLELHPSGDVIVGPGDILVLIGKTENLERLADLSAGAAT